MTHAGFLLVMSHLLKTARTTPTSELRQDGAVLPPGLQAHFWFRRVYWVLCLAVAYGGLFFPWLGLVLVPIMTGALEMRVDIVVF